jgi:D-alanyl-D-alanine carboxypeptidase
LSDAAVTALSGYAERADGEVLIFSIIVNGHSGGSAGAMDAVDRIAETLLDGPLSRGRTIQTPAKSE